MHILILTVGTGRNRTDIAEALAYSIRKQKPDKAVFFCSQKTFEETVPAVSDVLEGEYKYESIVFENENDVQFLYEKYLENIYDLKSQRHSISADFTSGTKAMSAALFAASVAANVAQVSYVTGKRDETGRVIESTNVIQFYPQTVAAYNQIEKARVLFNEMDYDAAVRLANENINFVEKKSRIGRLAVIIAKLGIAYMHWERFNWKQSADELKSVSHKKYGLYDFTDSQVIKSSADFCSQLDQNEWGMCRIVDLAENTSRRVKQRRFDDAMSRLYRAIEYFAQIRLQDGYNINTSTATMKDLKLIADKLSAETIDRFATKAGKNKPKGELKIGLREAIELLAELKDEVGVRMAEHYWNKDWKPNVKVDKMNAGKLQSWLGYRNNSYLAHGTTTVNLNVVKNLLGLLNELLDEFIDAELLEKYRKAAEFVQLEI